MLNNAPSSNTHLQENQERVGSGPDLEFFTSSAESPDSYLPFAMNRILSQVQKAECLPVVTDQNATQVLESVLIDPAEELEAPPVCLEIVQNGEHATVGTLGNFSLIIGKAKSRKTFLVTIALAAAVIRDRILSCFKGTFPDEHNTVLFFDTEQSKYHVLKAVKRVIALSGVPEPKNFRAFGLRKFTPAERLILIEKAIKDTPNLGMVVIDGIRDLVTSINDEEQATMIASMLLKWSEEKNIHIVCVLHQNKGDNNPRGHLGSELQNKAESVISVTKSTDNSDISIVSPEYCREKEFEPFAFAIDENGLPYLMENWRPNPKSGSARNGKKSSLPKDIPPEKHREILKLAFKEEPKLRHAQLIDQLKEALRTFSLPAGDSKALEFKVWYEREGFLEQNGPPSSCASYYILSEQVERTGLTALYI